MISRVLSRITLKLLDVGGNLVIIAGQSSSSCIGSFINWLNSRKLNPTIKGIMGATEMVPKTVPLDVTNGVELDPTPSWVPA